MAKSDEKCQMFSYFDEFYKAALFHFLASALCAALYALGVEYSADSEGNYLDYFIAAIVLSGIHCYLTVSAIVIFCVNIRYSVNARASCSVETKTAYKTVRNLYYVGIYISGLWSIVGAVIAGTGGVCTGYREQCSYSVNTGTNRAIAIIIIVVHVLNLLTTYLMIRTSRHPTRKRGTGLISLAARPRRTAPQQPTRQLEIVKLSDAKRYTDFQINKKSGRSQEQKTGTVTEVNNTRYYSTSDGTKTKLGKKQRKFYYDDSLLGRPVRRLSLPAIQNDIPSNDVKPLPKRNKKLLLPAVSKTIVQLNVIKNKNNEEARKTRALHLADNSLFDKEGEQLDSLRRNGDRLAPLPPAYDIAVSSPNPYWIPPVPDGYSDMHRMPDNIYAGDSYPDTDLVAIQPSQYNKYS